MAKGLQQWLDLGVPRCVDRVCLILAWDVLTCVTNMFTKTKCLLSNCLTGKSSCWAFHGMGIHILVRRMLVESQWMLKARRASLSKFPSTGHLAATRLEHSWGMRTS